MDEKKERDIVALIALITFAISWGVIIAAERFSETTKFICDYIFPCGMGNGYARSGFFLFGWIWFIIMAIIFMTFSYFSIKDFSVRLKFLKVIAKILSIFILGPIALKQIHNLIIFLF